MHMWKIEPAVQRGEKRAAEPAKQWNVNPIQVAMDDVEFVGAARDAFEQGGKRRSRIDRRAAQPERLWGDWGGAHPWFLGAPFQKTRLFFPNRPPRRCA